MIPRSSTIAGLRWTLGLVVLLESGRLAFAGSAIRHFAVTGLPPWLRPALAGTEILAALLFLVLATALAGGSLLLAVFALAVLLHLHHGEFDVGALFVYAMAAIVCMAHRRTTSTEPSHD